MGSEVSTRNLRSRFVELVDPAASPPPWRLFVARSSLPRLLGSIAFSAPWRLDVAATRVRGAGAPRAGAPRVRASGASAARSLRQTDDAELALEADAAMAAASDGYGWYAPMDSIYQKAGSSALPRAKEHHDNLHRTAHGWIEGFVPKAYSPFVAAVISYALLVCPFLVVQHLPPRPRVVPQKLLMAINIYNATYCAMLVVFNRGPGTSRWRAAGEQRGGLPHPPVRQVVAYLGSSSSDGPSPSSREPRRRT